jgi:hypothetical protein
VVGVGASWSIQQTPSRVANGNWEVEAARCSIVGGHAHCARGPVPAVPVTRDPQCGFVALESIPPQHYQPSTTGQASPLLAPAPQNPVLRLAPSLGTGS